MQSAAQRDKIASQVPVRKKRDRERKLSGKVFKTDKSIKLQSHRQDSTRQIETKHTWVQNGSQNLPDTRDIYPPLGEEVSPSAVWSVMAWDCWAPGMLEKMLKQRGKAFGPCSGGTLSPQVSLFDLGTTVDPESQTGQQEAMWEPDMFAT